MTSNFAFNSSLNVAETFTNAIDFERPGAQKDLYWVVNNLFKAVTVGLLCYALRPPTALGSNLSMRKFVKIVFCLSLSTRLTRCALGVDLLIHPLLSGRTVEAQLVNISSKIFGASLIVYSHRKLKATYLDDFLNIHSLKVAKKLDEWLPTKPKKQEQPKALMGKEKPISSTKKSTKEKGFVLKTPLSGSKSSAKTKGKTAT
ncbi:MAG: hypothetical protein ACOYK9_00645 [Chlamydiia bacterium]